MARRRYLSTRISVDSAVNRLALEAGDFGVLLYTWLIPHAADDSTFPCDPEELLLTVVPGRRDKTAADVQAALEAMVQLGLIEQVDAQRYGFPTEPFYRYQSYVKDAARRESTAPAAPNIKEWTSPENAGNLRSPAIVAENTVSVSSSVNVSSTINPPYNPPLTAPAPPTRPPASQPKPNKVALVIDALTAAGVDPPTISPRDGRAVKECKAAAEHIAAAYAAVVTGEWGDDWMRENLSLALVVERLNGYRASQTPRTARPRTTSRSSKRGVDAYLEILRGYDSDETLPRPPAYPAPSGGERELLEGTVRPPHGELPAPS